VLGSNLGDITEQVIGVDPRRRIRYRVIKGSPFRYHLGEIVVRAVGNETEVQWTIRFRSKLPFLGGLLRVIARPLLAKMLNQGLKRYVEHSPVSSLQPGANR
jgi:hypothetical protein